MKDKIKNPIKYHTEDVPDSIIKEIQSNSSKICKGKFSPGFAFFSHYCIVSRIDTSPPIIGGFVFLYITKRKDGSILNVSSFCSNKGQGNRLMDSVKTLAKSLEVSSIQVLYPEDEAISFYVKHGFNGKNGSMDMYYSVL